MKKLIGFGIAAMMVMGLAGAASAAIDDTWYVQLRATNASNGSNGTVTLGTKVGASDAYTITGSEDGILPSGSGARAFLNTDKAPTGQYVSKDVRAPLTVADIAAGGKVWNINVFQVGTDGVSKVAGNITITGWIIAADISKGTNVGLKGPWIGDDGKGSLDYWFPNDTTTATRGSVSAPLFTRTVYYDGVNDVQLQLVAVPEPGSMVAMFSGLVGLVGFGIRRRK